jgi:hypothetical protein
MRATDRGGAHEFHITRWMQVMDCVHEQSRAGQTALPPFCQIYSYPSVFDSLKGCLGVDSRPKAPDDDALTPLGGCLGTVKTLFYRCVSDISRCARRVTAPFQNPAEIGEKIRTLRDVLSAAEERVQP